MSEFQTSFRAIRTNDIKHIYSGFPQVVRMRQSHPYPTQDQLRLQAERSDLKTNVLRSTEFIPEYGCLIPRAPAFRILSRHEISNLVSRLTKPTIASQGITHTSDKDMLKDKERAHSKYLGLRTVDDKEMDGIVQRLTKKTQAVQIREYQTKTKMSEIEC